MPLLRTVVVAIIVLSSTAAWGQPKTDVVTLSNGDRITGEIVHLNRGRLEFKTDDAGTIYLEWDNIAGVEAVRVFEVITTDGRRFLGSLEATSARSVLVGVVPLPMSEVTNIAPIGASFWAKLDGSVDAGFTYTQSSGIAQATLNSSTVFRRPSFRFQMTASATITQQTGEDEPDDRAALELSYVRYRGRRWLLRGGGRLESNESLGLLLRSQINGAVGLRVVNTNRAQLEVDAGLVGNDEQGIDTDTDSTQNIEGLLALGTSFYSYDRPSTNVDVSVQYYPSLSHWGRQRLQFDSSVRRELWKDFFVALNVYDTFDSDPPNPDAARNDVGVMASVGWSY